ncbi:MAG: TldD/PmbA family protein, partial [Alphaproteobacteria bacterium]|nr:TldD/PmbA family protein [Alphaproteobacteria bacterium]
MAAATPSPMASSCRSGSAFALDRGLLYDLADIALTAAQQNGANYADLRIGETRREYAFAKDDRLENFDERESQGFGLRVLLDGCWGFYGARRLDPHSLRDGVERALENARAVKPIQLQPIELERLPVHEAEWIMPMGVDPFDVPASKKADLLLSIIASARDHGADFCTASLSAVCEERFFANSLGSRIHQTRTRVAPSFQAAA